MIDLGKILSNFFNFCNLTFKILIKISAPYSTVQIGSYLMIDHIEELVVKKTI